MNHLELIAWALCNGWSVERGFQVAIFTSPDGKKWDVPLTYHGVPEPDSYLASRIKGGMEYPGPTQEELQRAREGT